MARAAAPGAGPYTIVAQANNLGFYMTDGTGKVLLGITYTSSAHSQWYYYSSYVANGPLMIPAYCQSPNQTVQVYPGITVTSGPSTTVPSATAKHPWGTSSFSAIAVGNSSANSYQVINGNQGRWQQNAAPLFREGGGGGKGGGPHTQGRHGIRQAGGFVGCTIGSVTLLAAFGGVAATGTAAIGEVGLNPFADASFWGAMTAWGAAWGYWDDECF